MDTRLKVFFFCCGAIVCLVILYICIDQNSFTDKNYSIKLGSNLTYYQGNLTLVIGTTRNDSDRTLSIYGIENKSSWRIFSSFLSGESYKDINSNTISFNNDPVHTFKVTSVPTIIHVSVQKFQRGLYHGWWFINGNGNISVPVTLSSDPKIIQAIILVTIGVLLSIAFWEVVFFAYVKLSKEAAIRKRKKASKIIRRYLPGVQLREAQIHSLGDVDMQILQVPNDEKKQFESLRESATKNDNNANNTSKRYVYDMGKIFTVDGASIGFGILTGMIGILNNNFVMNLVEINWMQAGILIGIGVGIGSLKGLVDKPKTSE